MAKAKEQVTGAVDPVEDRAAAARGRVEALRSERAKAALAGRRFDHATLRDAEDDLAALQDAASEEVRRHRAAVAAAEANRVVRLKGEINTLDDQRRAAIEEAEALARAMVDALVRAEGARAGIASRLASMDVRCPRHLAQTDQDLLLSRGLCAVLKPLARGSGWGSIDFWSSPVRPADAWLALDQRAAEDVRAFLEENGDGEADGSRPCERDAGHGGAGDAAAVRPAAGRYGGGRPEGAEDLAGGDAEPPEVPAEA